MEKDKVQIMIHDLNPWGGQDRSMLEIAWQMNKTIPLDIHSYSLEGYENWPRMKHIRYQSKIKRPILFKYLSYHLQSARKIDSSCVTQSTGTASLKSDVIQVQFIHHSWQKLQTQMPADKTQSWNPFRRLYRRGLNRYKLLLEKRLYSPEKKYIAISHGIKKELIEHFNIPPKNISIIYHGVDPDVFSPWWAKEDGEDQRKSLRESLGFADSDRVLLHVGALNARKGIFKSLETLQYLKDQDFRGVKLLLVGQGDPKIIDEAIRSLGLQEDVVICPHSKTIEDYYRAADVFFFPTYYEPFGLVILEAMACGLPVLTTSVAGASEILVESSKGALVSADAEIKTLVQKLTPLLKSSDLRRQAGEEAREIALKHSWDSVGSEYQVFYRKYFREQNKGL